MLLESFQIIKENGSERFAIVDFSEFKQVREMLKNIEKLQDYLDYLHIQEIKRKSEKRYSSDEVKNELGL